MEKEKFIFKSLAVPLANKTVNGWQYKLSINCFFVKQKLALIKIFLKIKNYKIILMSF